MAAVDTRTQRNTVFGAFLASKNMTPETPIADAPTFYDEWEDYLYRSAGPGVTAGTALPMARPVNPSARLGSEDNPIVIPSRRGSY